MEIKFYETTDLNHAAVLLTKGARLVDTKKVYGVCTFIFGSSIENLCQKLVLLYLNDEVEGQLYKFVKAREELMSLARNR